MQRRVQLHREWVEFVSLVLVALNHRVEIDFTAREVVVASSSHYSFAVSCKHKLTLPSNGLTVPLTTSNERGPEHNVTRVEEPVHAAVDPSIKLFLTLG